MLQLCYCLRSCITSYNQIVATDAVVCTAYPAEVLQGFAKVSDVGYIAGFQVLGQFFLNSSNGPQVLALVFFGGHEEACQHNLHR